MADSLDRSFTRRREQQLLAELSASDRELVAQAMKNHPGVSLVKTLEMLKAFGGL